MCTCMLTIHLESHRNLPSTELGGVQELEKEMDQMGGGSPVASDSQVASDSLVRAYLRRGASNVDSRRGASPRALHRASPSGERTTSPSRGQNPNLGEVPHASLG